MALKLNKELPNGVTVTYWKVAKDGLTINSSKSYSEQQIPINNPEPCMGIMLPMQEENPQIQMIIYGYLDEATRREGHEPIIAMMASIPCPVEGNFADERRPLLYGMLKLQEYWKDALDC